MAIGVDLGRDDWPHKRVHVGDGLRRRQRGRRRLQQIGADRLDLFAAIPIALRQIKCIARNQKRILLEPKGRVVIDSNGFNRFSCNEGVYLNPLWTKERAEDDDGTSDHDNDEGMDDDDGEDNGMPYEGEFLEDDNPYGAVTLTDEQRLITTPVVRGYSLS